jgi:hypothetical protein
MMTRRRRGRKCGTSNPVAIVRFTPATAEGECVTSQNLGQTRVDIKKGCALHHRTGEIFALNCITLKSDRGFSLVAIRVRVMRVLWISTWSLLKLGFWRGVWICISNLKFHK